MDHITVQPDETLEDLQLNGLKILQKKTGFRFGMDSVLLAHFADIRERDTVADFGTGCGILPLLLIGRNKGNHFYGFEIQESIAEMAERSVRINHLENTVHIIQADAGKAPDYLAACSIDAVVCNPPYGIPGTVLSSPVRTRAVSRSQGKNTLELFFRSAFRVLKGRGRFIMVYPASQMLQAMQMLQKAHLEPKKFQMVYPYENKPANLVLIEAVKDARPSLHPMPPLIVFDEKQILTNRLKSVYHIDK